MFVSARWRSDRNNKIKADFKLQFHATQVLKSGVEAMVLSVVAGEAGKPTARLEKAEVRDGICKWEKAVYETVKFVRDPKTGKINPRIYHFLVSTGSTKGGLYGEVTIDFAHYAEALKPSTVSLPLKNSLCGAVLHVSIQRLQENVEQREVEENLEVRRKSVDRSLRTYLSNSYTDESIESNSSEDASAKGTGNRVQLSANSTSSSGSEITLSSSESSSGLNTPREIALINSTTHQDPAEFVTSFSHQPDPSNCIANDSTSVFEEHQRSPWEWSAGSGCGLNKNDSRNSSQHALPKDEPKLPLDMEIEKLKAEIVILSRQVDVSELELQTLRRQIVKESKRGQDLSKEVVGLKEERDALKSECEKLKSFQQRTDEAKMKTKLPLENGDLRALVEEIRQELNYEKDLNANLWLQLQKTQESNAELILAVQDLEEILEQKNRETPFISNRSECSKIIAQDINGRSISKCDTYDDEEQKALEELVKEHSNAKETYLLEQKIIDLCSEIEIYRRDKDELEMHMEQLALDYEILKQENHGITYKLEQSQLQEQLKIQYDCSSSGADFNDLESLIQSLEDKLKKRSEAHSDALATIKELKTHINILENELDNQSREHSDSRATTRDLESHTRALEEELDRQAQCFEADLEAITHSKVEQEQRAIRAEEALRTTKLKNANAAEKLQEEFRRLSMQMASTFDANEKVALKAMTEASELRSQKIQLEETIQKLEEELQFIKDDHEAKLFQFTVQIDTKTHQIEKMVMEIDEKSKQLENHQKHEETVSRELFEKIQMLKSEKEKLRAEITSLNEQAEQKEKLNADLECMKKSNEENETLIERGNLERSELVAKIDSVNKESEKFLGEMSRMRHVNEEKEKIIVFLRSELETLTAQCTDLKHSVLEDELEKEKLRKQVFQLKGDLKKKNDALANVEKKLKDSNCHVAPTSDGAKASPKNKKSALPHNSKEITSMKERMKMLEAQIRLRETALGTSTNSFLEKERDLHNKIEELESRLEEINQSSASQKVTEDRSVSCISSVTDSTSNENGDALPLSGSTHGILLEKEGKTAMVKDRNNNFGDLLTELAVLKEKNQCMENELHEMQERYSEISLKFAEVEGERQKLVMTIRNLKNAKKSS